MGVMMKKNITMFLVILFGINVAHAAPKFNFLAGVFAGTGIGSAVTYAACGNQGVGIKNKPIFESSGVSENSGLRKKAFDTLNAATSFKLGLKVGITSNGVACAVSGCGIDYKIETPQDATKLVGFEAEVKVSPLTGEFNLVKPGRIALS